MAVEPRPRAELGRTRPLGRQPLLQCHRRLASDLIGNPSPAKLPSAGKPGAWPAFFPPSGSTSLPLSGLASPDGPARADAAGDDGDNPREQGQVVEIVVAEAPEGEVRYQVVVEGTRVLVLSPRAVPRAAQVWLSSDYATMAAVASGELSALEALSAGRARCPEISRRCPGTSHDSPGWICSHPPCGRTRPFDATWPATRPGSQAGTPRPANHCRCSTGTVQPGRSARGQSRAGPPGLTISSPARRSSTGPSRAGPPARGPRASGYGRLVT